MKRRNLERNKTRSKVCREKINKEEGISGKKWKRISKETRKGIRKVIKKNEWGKGPGKES